MTYCHAEVNLSQIYVYIYIYIYMWKARRIAISCGQVSLTNTCMRLTDSYYWRHACASRAITIYVFECSVCAVSAPIGKEHTKRAKWNLDAVCDASHYLAAARSVDDWFEWGLVSEHRSCGRLSYAREDVMHAQRTSDH